MKIIEFKNVSKSYKNNMALKDVDISIEEGEFVTVIGTSGCGKTTFIKLINGLIKADLGEILIEGKSFNEKDFEIKRREIGYVVQSISLFPHLNIEKNLSYVLDLEKKINKEEKNKKIDEILSIIGLEKSILKRYSKELSGGQRQRVGIGRALINNPKIILMDEPFGNVDEITRKSLQEEILRIHKKRKITIVFITHDIREAMRLGQKIVVMDKGKIIQSGDKNEIIKNPKTEFVENLVKNSKW
ncbi:MAG: ATP-binding cassette domain-containing protein [Clostridium sp.]|uniref:ATP-binding cassette domain-containing protein n=1 Tax=Clostridium sp. TaxID=1506 RepID=UPI003EE79635